MTDNGDGTYSITLTGALAGSDTIQATDSTLGFSSNTDVLTVSPGPATQVVLTNGCASSVVSGATCTLTATVQDAAGNTVTTQTGDTVTFADSVGPGTVSGLSGTVTDNGDGTYSITLTGALAGSDTIQATDSTLGFSSNTDVLTVSTGPATQVVLTNGCASSVVSGATCVETAMVEDGAGNTVTTQTGDTVTFADSVGAGTFSGLSGTVTDNGDGTYSITLTGALAGSDTIQATDSTLGFSSNTDVLTVTPGAPTQLAIFNDCSSYLTTGATCGLTAVLQDASGNTVVDGSSVTFAQSGVGVVTGLSSVTPNGDGTYSVTITGSTDGAVSISAADSTDSITASISPVDFTVQGTATHLVITSNTCGSNLNAGATCTLVATLEDASNNPVVDGSSVTFAQGGSDVGAVTGLDGDSVTDNGDGTYTVTVTGRANGAVSISAADSSDAITTSSPVVDFTVQGGSVNTAMPTTFVGGVPGPYPNDYFNSVACPSSGNCVAVGQFQDVNGYDESFTATETSGVWGNAVPTTFDPSVLSTDRPYSTFSSVACSSVGNCVAVGQFYDASDQYESFIATELNGVWGNGVPLTTFPYSTLSSVACSSDGNCVAVGQFLAFGNNWEPFTATELNGTWGDGVPITFTGDVLNTTYPSAYSYLNSVACPSDGNCVAVGEFYDVNRNYVSFTATELNGTWGNAVPTLFAPNVQNTNPSDYFSSVACTSTGNCVAVGDFYDVNENYQSFTATELNGVWGNGMPTMFAPNVQNTNPSDSLYSVACPSAGNCVAVGYFHDVNGNYPSFTVTESDGVWGNGMPTTFASGVQNTSPNDYFNAVACASAGNCVGVGSFGDVAGHNETFTATETNGVWGNGVPTTFASGVQNTNPSDYFSSVACATDGSCVAVGQFKDVNRNYQSFILGVTVILARPFTPPTTGPTNAAPPASAGVSPSDFGTPTSGSASSTTITSVTSDLGDSSSGVSASVSVPAGALPDGTTVSVYPITNTAPLVAQVPPGNSYVLSFAVSWQAPDGTSPAATAAITLTITDPSIKAGNSIYELTSTGLTLVGTATVDGSVTITFTNDPTFLVTAKTLVAQAGLSITSLRGTLGKALTLVTSGGSGTGALSFSVTNGTASGCTLTGNSLSASSAGTCVVTAAKAADSTYLGVSSGASDVAFAKAVPANPASAFRPVVGTFAVHASALTKATKNALINLSRKLKRGASVTITGYALKNIPLALARAHAAQAYLVHLVKVHVAIKVVTNQSIAKVKVVVTAV